MAGRLSRRCRRAVAAAAGGGWRIPRRAPRRRSVAILAAVMVSATGLTLAVAAGPAQAQAQADAWKPCGSAAANGRIERVEILLALDRSGSLQNVDPDGTKRRRATHGTRERLALLQNSVSQLLRGSGSGLDFGIEVALVAFDTDGETLAGFAPAGADHPSDLAIEAALGAGGDTDYRPALEQALARFENSPNVDSDTTCRVLVLFTDGILDPYDTAAGRRPALESQATTHVSNLLADLCDAGPGMRRYRKRMEDRGVSTYVAVLKGPAFERGAGGSHLDELANASKQAILAVTGHGGSPLLGSVTAAAGCESWSGVRAGKVVEIEDIGDLTDELANAVGEVGLAVRQPRIRCSRQPTIEDPFEDEWPHRLAVGDAAEGSLCTVTPPLDGEMVLNLVGGGGLPTGVEWLIDDEDDGGEPTSNRTLGAGDDDLSFDVVSSLLPEDEPVGAVADAAVRIAATWYPDPEQLVAWPDQPPEVPLASPTLRFDVPDREAYLVERLIDCRVHQRSNWADAAGGTRAEVTGLCTVEAPPAGEFELSLEASDGNRLAWRASRVVSGNVPEELARSEPVLVVPRGEGVSLGAFSQILGLDEIPLRAFEDAVVFELAWRSPNGAVLVSRSVPDPGIRIAVSPTTPDLLECGAGAQMTAARQNRSGEWQLVVDTGCRLPSPPQGAVRATVSGGVRGEAWTLVDPPAAGEGSWPTRDDIVLAPSEPHRTLFVGIGHSELADMVGEAVMFTLVATLSAGLDGASEALDEQREPLTVTVYLPLPRCEPDEVEAVRVDIEPSGGEEPEQRARARNLCEVDPPPNGRLEIRTTGVDPGPTLSWRPGLITDAPDDPFVVSDDPLRLDPGGNPVWIGALSDPVPPEALGAFVTGIAVELDWRSERGHSSGSAGRVVVAVAPEAPELLECTGTPQVGGAPIEVPEGPLVVDTGCVVPAPEVGVVTLGVEGSVAGVRWRVPEPARLVPGDPDRPVLVESAGPLPNEPLDVAASFELVATLILEDYEPPADRRQREMGVRLPRRIRLSCTGTPHIVGAPIEVPDGPLVVDTGCTLLAPGAGTVTVSVDGGVAGVPWTVLDGTRLGPGDDDLPILIETTEPLPNRRYEDVVAEFALAATWRSPDGLEQNVGEQPSPGQASPEVAAALRARPNAGNAVLIAVALLLGGLLAGWLLLAGLGRRANGLPRSGAYRVVSGEATATVAPGRDVQLEGFDLRRILGGESKPVERRRGRLQAADLAIGARRQWWNPRDLLSGGRAAAVPQGMKDTLVAAAPSAGRPDSLRPSLAHCAVIVALDPAPAVSTEDARRHRCRVWILRSSAPKRAPGARDEAESDEAEARRNLRTALRGLGRRLGPDSGDRAQPPTPRDPAKNADRRPPPPPRDSRPKGS